MRLVISDDKRILKSIAGNIGLAYDNEDVKFASGELCFMYISRNCFTYSLNSGEATLYSFNSYGRTVNICVNIPDIAKFDVIKAYFNTSFTEVINAFSMDSPSQLAFYTLKTLYLKSNAYHRLWLDDLTVDNISIERSNLELDESYDPLALAYLFDVITDEMFSMVSLKELDIRLDRKQTFILNLLEAHDEVMELFSSRRYFLIRVKLENNLSGSFSRFKGSERFYELAEAQELVNRLSGEQFTTLKFELEEKRKSPPLLMNLFDLCALGKDKFSFDDVDTLEVLLSLYHRGFITNPETTGRLLPPNVHLRECMKILSLLSENYFYPELFNYILSKPYVESEFSIFISSVSDNSYGIRPTLSVPNSYLLTEQERYFYFKIVESFYRIFCGSMVVYRLKLRGVYYSEYQLDIDEDIIYDHGHAAVELISKNNELTASMIRDIEERNKSVVYENNDYIDIMQYSVKESSNRAPAPMTAAMALRLLEQSGRKKMSTKDKIRLKDHGIGTLIEREQSLYSLVNEGLISYDSETGNISLVDEFQEKLGVSYLPDNQVIKDISSMIVSIRLGTIELNEAYDIVRRLIYESIQRIRYQDKNPSVVDYKKILKHCVCPFCGGSFKEFRYTINCKSCSLKVPKERAGRKLRTIEIIKLINHRTTPMINGFTFKNGRTGSAKLIIDDEKKIVFDFRK